MGKVCKGSSLTASKLTNAGDLKVFVELLHLTRHPGLGHIGKVVRHVLRQRQSRFGITSRFHDQRYNSQFVILQIPDVTMWTLCYRDACLLAS